MLSRKERLNSSTKEIYEHLTNNFKNYEKYSPEEKIKFVEDAFHNVNKYYGAFYEDYNQNDTKFGFFVGKMTFNAVTYQRSKAIAYDLTSALNGNNPRNVYRTMFHEFRHIRQGSVPILTKLSEKFRYYGSTTFKKDNEGNLIKDNEGKPIQNKKIEGKIIPKIINRLFKSNESKQENLKWTFSGGEIGANMSARNMLSRISRFGILKGDIEKAKDVRFNFLREHFQSNLFPKQFEKYELRKSSDEYRKNYQESKEKWKTLTEDEKKSFKENSLRPLFFKETKGDIYLFSREDVCNVLKNSPIRKNEEGFFNVEDKQKFVKELIKFGHKDNIQRHVIGNFFGEFHKESRYDKGKRVFIDDKYARFDAFGNLKERNPIFESSSKMAFQGRVDAISNKVKERIMKIQREHEENKFEKKQNESQFDFNAEDLNKEIGIFKSGDKNFFISQSEREAQERNDAIACKLQERIMKIQKEQKYENPKGKCNIDEHTETSTEENKIINGDFLLKNDTNNFNFGHNDEKMNFSAELIKNNPIEECMAQFAKEETTNEQ